MLNALYISALGMQAQKTQLDVISNNLANANTAGFKRERVEFSAVLDQQQMARTGAIQVESEAARAPGGAGVIRRDLAQGELKQTDSALDVAVNGMGFIEVVLDSSRLGYVRGGSLRINDEGYLTTADGLVLKADIRVPSGAADLRIDAQGRFTARLNGDQSVTEMGRIQLVAFSNPDTLNYLGSGVFEMSADTAEPARGVPSEEGFGSVASGRLEMSNVKLVDEMVALMLAQRVYELNSKVVQAADEVMGLNNSLRKS